MTTSDALLAAVTPFVEQAPAWLDGSTQGSCAFYTLVCSPELLWALAHGTYRQVLATGPEFSAPARAEAGSACRSGLFRPGGVGIQDVERAALQVMALISSPRLLDDLRLGLADLDRVLDEIQPWLEPEPWAALDAHRACLVRIAVVVDATRSPHLTPGLAAQQVLSLDRESASLHDRFEQDLQASLDAFQYQDVGGNELEAHAEALLQHGLACHAMRAAALAALKVRVLTARVWIALPVAQEALRDCLGEVIELYRAHRRACEPFEELVAAKLEDLKRAADQHRAGRDPGIRIREVLEGRSQAAQGLFDGFWEGIEACATAIETMENHQAHGLSLAVGLDETGAVTQVNLL